MKPSLFAKKINIRENDCEDLEDNGNEIYPDYGPYSDDYNVEDE